MSAWHKMISTLIRFFQYGRPEEVMEYYYMRMHCKEENITKSGDE